MATAFTANQQTVSSFYLSYYGRPADPAGLAYWAAQLDKAGGNLDSIVSSFASSAESTARFSDLTPAQHITSLYQELLGRPPEAAGAAYWLGEVTAGRMTIAQLAINVHAGAQGVDVATVDVRQALADQFTAALPADGAGYTGLAAVEAARLVIQAANATTSAADVATLANAGVKLAASATANPAVITALTGANGSLTDLLGTAAGKADPLALVNLVNTIVTAAAGDAASLTTLLGTGTLTDVITTLPAGTTLTGLDTAITGGGLAGGGVVVNPPVTPPGGGDTGGGGNDTPATTPFEVKNVSGVVTFENGSGDITMTVDGINTVFTRGAVSKSVVTADITSKITVATGQTLSATAAVVTGKTIDGAGTVAVTALESTLTANLSGITSTNIKASITGGGGNFNGNIGNATLNVISGNASFYGGNLIVGQLAKFEIASGAILIGKSADFTAKAVTGAGGVLGLIMTSADASFNATNIQESVYLTFNLNNGVEIDFSANTTLGGVDYYYVTDTSQLTLSAEQVSGKLVENSLSNTPGGKLIIKGLTGSTDLSLIGFTGSAYLPKDIEATVTSSVDFSNANLTKLTALTVDADVVVTFSPQQYAALKGNVTVVGNGSFKSSDTTAPTTTIASAAYDEDSNTLTLSGDKFTELLETGESAATDIKGRLDWSKLVWDINGDGTTTTNVSFAEGDISSALVTNGTTLTIKLTDAKGSALEGTTEYHTTGSSAADTIVITAGFARDLSDNAATTDGLAAGVITIAADNTAPTMVSAALAADGKTLTLTYSKEVAGSFEEADWVVTIGGSAAAITSVAAGATKEIVLTLTTPVATGVAITSIAYTATGGGTTDNSVLDTATPVANAAAAQTLSTGITNNSAVDLTAPDAVDLSSTANVQATSSVAVNAAEAMAGKAIAPDIQAPTATDIHTIKITMSGTGLAVDRADKDRLVLDVDRALNTNFTGTSVTINSITGLDYAYTIADHTLLITKHSGGALMAADIDNVVAGINFKGSTDGERIATISYIDGSSNTGASAAVTLTVDAAPMITDGPVVTNATTITLTSNEAGLAGLYGNTSTLVGSTTTMVADTSNTITVAAQANVTTTNLIVTDTTNNTRQAMKVVLGTTGADSITASTKSDFLFGFGGADTFTLFAGASPFYSGDTVNGANVIGDYQMNVTGEKIVFGGTATVWATAVTDWTINNGVATKSGSTVADFYGAFKAATGTAGEVIAYVKNGNTYLFGEGVSNANTDDTFVVLVGVTATSVATTEATSAVMIG